MLFIFDDLQEASDLQEANVPNNENFQAYVPPGTVHMELFTAMKLAIHRAPYVPGDCLYDAFSFLIDKQGMNYSQALRQHAMLWFASQLLDPDEAGNGIAKVFGFLRQLAYCAAEGGEGIHSSLNSFLTWMSKSVGHVVGNKKKYVWADNTALEILCASIDAKPSVYHCCANGDVVMDSQRISLDGINRTNINLLFEGHGHGGHWVPLMPLVEGSGKKGGKRKKKKKALLGKAPLDYLRLDNDGVLYVPNMPGCRLERSLEDSIVKLLPGKPGLERLIRLVRDSGDISEAKAKIISFLSSTDL